MISTVFFHILNNLEWHFQQLEIVVCLHETPGPSIQLCLHYDIGFFRCDIIVSFYTWDKKRWEYESNLLFQTEGRRLPPTNPAPTLASPVFCGWCKSYIIHNGRVVGSYLQATTIFKIDCNIHSLKFGSK